MSKYLKFLVDEIHSVVFATTDDDNFPVTCVIDIMLSDENSLYFLTAKGKSFYQRLKNHENISLTGFKGEDTMSSKSITIRGKAREVGSDLLVEIFQKNQYMNDIYKSPESRKSLTVFQIFEGFGEFFDLSCRPIFREDFSFGDALEKSTGYFITENCTACGSCLKVCPQNCIEISGNRAKINKTSCLHCGGCLNICPNNAILRS